MSDPYDTDLPDPEEVRAVTSARAAEDDARQVPTVTADELRAAAHSLEQLDWGEEGLNRDQIRRKVKGFPEGIYLHMLATKKYTSAGQVLHEVSEAANRAEGEFMGEDPDVPEAESIGDGGPPAWGGDPIFSVRGIEDGGSAEDRESLDEDE